MNKYLLLLILPLLTLISCDDDDNDATPMDLRLFAGTWQVVDKGNQKLFDKDCILDITSSQIHEGYGGYEGYITSYILTAEGATLHDSIFSWSIRNMENRQPLLDLEVVSK